MRKPTWEGFWKQVYNIWAGAQVSWHSHREGADPRGAAGLSVPWQTGEQQGPMPRPGASQVGLVVKNPPANAGDIRDTGLIPGSGRFPGEGHGNPTNILAWRIPWTEEPGGLQSTGPQRIGHN